MCKKIQWIITSVLAIFSPALFALGLGGASVESYLDQPLDVRVEVISQSSEELQSVTVGLASADDFEMLGLSRSAITVPLEFKLVSDVRQPYIHITSDLKVNEPVVQVLVEVVWASGRMLREYTLFLDPPTISSSAPQPDITPAPQPAVVETPPVESQPAAAVTMPLPAVVEEPAAEEVSIPETMDEAPVEEAVEEVVEDTYEAEAVAADEPVDDVMEEAVEQAVATEVVTDDAAIEPAAAEETATEEIATEKTGIDATDDEAIEEDVLADELATEDATGAEEVIEPEAMAEELVDDDLPMDTGEEVADAMDEPEQETVREQEQQAESRDDAYPVDEEIYGPVERGETLWGIAREYSRDTGHSINQTMLALQRKNPEAFISGNINFLKRGAILRMPEGRDITRLTSRQAMLEVMRQEEEWRSGIPSVAPDYATPVVDDSGDYQEYVADEPAEPVAEEDTGHLELVPPVEEGTREELLAEPSPSTQAIKEELSRTEEELINVQQENTYLAERIQELESETEAQTDARRCG